MLTQKQLDYRIRQAETRKSKVTQDILLLENECAHKGLTKSKLAQNLKRLEKMKDQLQEKQKTIEDLNKMSNDLKTSEKGIQAQFSFGMVLEKVELLEKKAKDQAAHFEEKMENFAMDLRRERERNGDLLRQYNRLELAYQSAQDRFKTLQMHIDQVSKVHDRVLMIESQIRDLQLRLKQLVFKQDSSKGSYPALEQDVLVLRRNVDGLQHEQKRLSQMMIEKQTNDGGLSYEGSKVYLPQSSSIRSNTETEPLDEIWSPIFNPSSNVQETEHELMWPLEMNDVLDKWLIGKNYWGHQDWLDLLDQLVFAGFEQYAKSEFHSAIGAYLENHRAH